MPNNTHMLDAFPIQNRPCLPLSITLSFPVRPSLSCLALILRFHFDFHPGRLVAD
jgi:hypothetical protein